MDRRLSLSQAIRDKIPSSPRPPIVGNVTPRTIELMWTPPASHTAPLVNYWRGERREQGSKADETELVCKPFNHDLVYHLEEENVDKETGFVKVYRGHKLYHLLTGRTSMTMYRYRIQCSSPAGISEWSPAVSVSTQSLTCTSETLHQAVKNNDFDSVLCVVGNHPDFVDVVDTSGASALMTACYIGAPRMAELLLLSGANPDFNTSSTRKTSLMEASFYGHNKCAQLLLEYGAQLLAEDLTGMVALDYAIAGNQKETVELLLSEHAPVDYVGKRSLSGQTPLLRLAATNGESTVAEILIENNANVNHRDDEKRTPLMLAANGGNVTLLELLLNYGAKTMLTDSDNKTALEYALQSKKEFAKQRVSVPLMQAMEKERACVAKAAQYRRSLEDAEIPTSVAEELEQEMLLKLLKDND